MGKKVASKKEVIRSKNKTVVAAKVSGGKLQMVEAATLGELKETLDVENYQATIDGEPQSDNDYKLQNDSVVILTAPVKGA